MPPKKGDLKRKKSSQDACDSEFLINYDLKKHITSIHEENKSECDICNKNLANKNSLKVHIKSFHGNGEKRHKVAVHRGMKPLQCHYCEKIFAAKSGLTSH